MVKGDCLKGNQCEVHLILDPKLRLLKESDIPDIIEISKTTWGGHDHLPHKIGEWLENPQCHPYVFERDEKVIGVANIRIIDEGKTAWLEGLRVHEDVRQKGLGQKMTNHLVDISKNLDVQRLRLVTSGDNIAPIKLAASIGMKQMLLFQVFWKGYRRKITWRNNSIEVEQIEPEDVPEFLEKHPDLVPLNALVFHWDVFDVTAKKIIDIGKSAKYFAGTNDSGATLTVSGDQTSSYGPEWCFTLYATSPDSFLSGLSKNLEVSQEMGIQNLWCIHSPEFVPLYDSTVWLKRRNHEISLILHERIL